MKEDRIDVEPCYPLFSAELGSAKALASFQQKFQTLNLADYKVFPLATDEEIEPDDLCPMKTPKVIEETFLRTMKQVWILNTTGRTELMILYCALLFLRRASNLFF